MSTTEVTKSKKKNKKQKNPKTTTPQNLKITYIDSYIHEQQRVQSITLQLCVVKLPKDI